MRQWVYALAGGALLSAAAALIASPSPMALAQAHEGPAQPSQATTAYDFTLTAIDGRPLPLARFRGQVMLVVNTASMCGLTPQYEGLVELQRRYAARGFTVIGVPSGDFLNQEHADNREIAEFCRTRFGVDFPLAERSHVRGPHALPFYRWARQTLPSDNVPLWNFHKFLVDREGRLVRGFGSRTSPTSPEVRRAIEAALG